MADTSHALAIMPTSGVDTYRMSTDAASISKAIVVKTAMEIQGRKYVKVEGWQAIALAHGCTASSCNVERVDGGFKAVGQVRRMDTGQAIAEAEGFVGEDEPVWFGGESVDRWGKKKVHPKRPDYAIRAMAQTRAISRACRSAFAHVVVMMDAGLQTTPAEEVPYGGFDDQPPPAMALVDPADRNLVKGDGRSTYQTKTAEKAPGRLAAELWASQAVTLFRMPDFNLLHYREWKETAATPGGRKSNGEKLDELRDKHPDLAEAIDDVVADLKPAVLQGAT